MTGAFTRKYGDAERAAVAAAFETMTAKQVAAAASAGQLADADGVPLEAFELPDSSVRSIARDQRKRRAGRRSPDSSSLASAAPRDAIEALRQKLVRAAERGLASIERWQDEHGGEPKSWEDLRQAIRCVREAAALPGPTDPRPVAPGAKVGDGQRLPGDSETRGGQAGALLLAHRAGGAVPAPSPPVEYGVARNGRAPEPESEPESEDLTDPGEFARAAAARTLSAAADGSQAGGNAPLVGPVHGPLREPQRRDRDEVNRKGMPDEDTSAFEAMPRRRRAR